MDTNLDWEEILEVLRIVQESSCEEIRLEVGDFKLVIKKTATGGDASGTVSVEEVSVSETVGRTEVPGDASSEEDSAGVPSATVEPAPGRTDGASPDVDAEPAPQSDLVKVKSPMIGIFYRAPSPGKPPFVEVGDSVNEGDPIGIIDVMKLMNTVKSPSSGLVREISAENAAMVEYGQTLMLLEPT